jgi:HAMP domain-containing protein
MIRELQQHKCKPALVDSSKNLETEIKELHLQLQTLVTEKRQAEDRVKRLEALIEQNYDAGDLHTKMKEELAVCKAQVEAKLKDAQKARQRDNIYALQEKQALQQEVERLQLALQEIN